MKKLAIVLLISIVTGCNSSNNHSANSNDMDKMDFSPGTFGYDVDFLKKYQKDIIVLGEEGSSQILISPAFQARVMTSTASGDEGASFGWINYHLIASGTFTEHMNAYGGEERFWLGPEGGQFSIFFKKGDEFIFDNWQVPKEIDTESFELVSSTGTEAGFKKEMRLENYSGTSFDLRVDRTINLLNRNTVNKTLDTEIPGDLEMVAFESVNRVTNTGQNPWDKKTGLLSIWILSMLKATDQTTVAIPYKIGDSVLLGKIVTDDYFGKVPSDRLKVNDKLILFKADGNYRSKIGISPKRALPLAASFDSRNNVLTIAQFSLPEGNTDYVNSLWELQDDPFSGDAINSYNDGMVDGSQMGKFYEVESSSPAAALAPGETIEHLHRIIHLKGSREELDKISVNLLGVHLDEIRL